MPREADLFSLLCQECGRRLIHTPSGFLSCPLGHGRLRLDEAAPEVDVIETLFSLEEDL